MYPNHVSKHVSNRVSKHVRFGRAADHYWYHRLHVEETFQSITHTGIHT
jgi:hypothetical protein